MQFTRDRCLSCRKRFVKGTAFKMLFLANQVAAPHVATIATNENWKGNGTLLLVDDEESILRTGEQLLRYIGFNVITEGCQA